MRVITSASSWTPFWHALCTCRRSVPCTRSSCLQGAPPRWCTCLWHGLLGALRRVPRPRRFSRASVCRPRGPFGDMLVRHAVVVLVASEVYAAVGGHLEARVGDYLKVRCRQRPQVGAVDGRKRSSRVYGFFCMRFWLCLRILSVAAAFSSSME